MLSFDIAWRSRHDAGYGLVRSLPRVLLMLTSLRTVAVPILRLEFYDLSQRPVWR